MFFNLSAPQPSHSRPSPSASGLPPVPCVFRTISASSHLLPACMPSYLAAHCPCRRSPQVSINNPAPLWPSALLAIAGAHLLKYHPLYKGNWYCCNVLWAIEFCVEVKCHNTDTCRKVQNFNKKKKEKEKQLGCSFYQHFLKRTAASTFLLKSCNKMLGQTVNYATDADTKTSKIIFVKIPLNKVTHLIHTVLPLPNRSCFYIEIEMKWCL